MGDLMIREEDSIAIMTGDEKGLGNLITPLVNEIHLFDTFIAGTTHLNDDSVLDEVSEGTTLTLRREGDNKYDSKAILLLAPSGKKIGYIPQKDNLIFSRLMDAGKLLTARITSISEQNPAYKRIGISIYLVDF